MNSITRKMLLIGFALLLCACVRYPSYYSYYPGYEVYSSGYIITHRNYYGIRPYRYDNGYRYGNAYFPHHHYYDQHHALPRWNNEHSEHQYQHGGDHDHPFNYGHNRQRDDDNHRNNFGWRNHH
ncbi:MAG: hypothetical protein QX199_15380 [Methylococcaceae bacterium]